MLFNSYAFIFAFLPIALAFYFLAARFFGARLAVILLVILSFAFYAFSDWHAIFVLAASIAFNYTMGRILKSHPQGWLLFAGIAGNLAALGYFKHAAFLINKMSTITSLHIPVPHWVTPLGISFFTFTQIAFLADTVRGETEDLSLWRYSLFVVFFPYLISGPIVRYREIIKQVTYPGATRWARANVHSGIMFFSLGLAKKVLISGLCAPWANAFFESAMHGNCLEAWGGVLSYTMQLYFDFSGYSDMAIGLAMFFNVRLPDNFNSPYKSESIVDFWQRWHITLAQFLREYVYFPLVFRFRAPYMRFVSLLLVMLLCGLWHGAGWTFIIWGGYHGTLLAIAYGWQNLHRPLPSPVARVVTFIAIIIGWVFFRARDLPAAFSTLESMFRFKQLSLDGGRFALAQWLVLVALLLFVNVAPTTKDWVESRELGTRHAIFAGAMLFLCLLCMRTSFVELGQSMFIYFRF